MLLCFTVLKVFFLLFKPCFGFHSFPNSMKIILQIHHVHLIMCTCEFHASFKSQKIDLYALQKNIKQNCQAFRRRSAITITVIANARTTFSGLVILEKKILSENPTKRLTQHILISHNIKPITGFNVVADPCLCSCF